MSELFNFAHIQVGDTLTRVIYNLWTNKAVVDEITDTKIRCSVYVDCVRSMDFNRRTGVHIENPSFGLVVNRYSEGRDYVEQLRKDLQDSIQTDNEMPAETIVCVRMQLAHSW